MDASIGLLTIAVAVLVVGSAFAVFGAWVAGEKGRGAKTGAVVGACFGPLGVLILALLPAVNRAAPRRTPQGKGTRRRSVVAVPEMPTDWQPEPAREKPPTPEDEDEQALRYLTGPE